MPSWLPSIHPNHLQILELMLRWSNPPPQWCLINIHTYIHTYTYIHMHTYALLIQICMMENQLATHQWCVFFFLFSWGGFLELREKTSMNRMIWISYPFVWVAWALSISYYILTISMHLPTYLVAIKRLSHLPTYLPTTWISNHLEFLTSWVPLYIVQYFMFIGPNGGITCTLLWMW